MAVQILFRFGFVLETCGEDRGSLTRIYPPAVHKKVKHEYDSVQ